MNTKNEYGQFMARKHKKMALYEVFSKSGSNSRQNQNLERLHPADSSKKTVQKQDIELSHKPTAVGTLRLKPRIWQLNQGRVEISLPYPLAVAALLGLILLIVIAFRLGQIQSMSNLAVPVKVAAMTNDIEPENINVEQDEISAEQVVSETVSAAAGNNRIVLQTWKDESQLIPVQAYFNSFGIDTEIKKVGQRYFLVTKTKYENPKRLGTDGYKARQKIIEIGANYVPPPGFGSFDFSSAYGMKFDD